MAALTHAESRRLYSWWWDSHISPKNSKWLQENLTDMDVKVKTMIKLIEEDADSFARRAEMYYKKRPELMKLVEEFYRAYRALAERYDHATGALRQAHRTMAEAFPNQIPFSLPDDTPPSSSAADSEPHTPEMPRPIRALFEPDDLQMEDLGHSSECQTVKKNGAFSDENDCMTSKKGLKQLNEMFGSNEKRLPELGEGRVRKGLNFQVEEGKGSEFKMRNGTSGSQKHKSEVQEKGVQYEALDLEERENGDNESSRLQEDEVSRLSTENQNLKLQVLSESEKFKKEASDLNEALAKLKDEKEAALLQSQQCLDRYRGALGRISELETEIALAQEDVKGLNDEILKGITKSRSFEERSLLSERENQNLRLEMDNLVRKLMTQQEEIKQKHFELEKLGICVQEEHLNSMRIEAALHNLQQLHSQSQEEQRALSLELQNGVTILKNTENRNRDLENEIQRIKEENNSLNEQNVSSAISIRNLQDELHSWMDKNAKLEEEVGLRVDQRNALQQELYCLKEELNDLQRRYRGLTEQIESVGLDPVSIRSSIKELQDENSNLKETCRIKGEEKSVFLEKLGNMDKLSEKNKFLENSLSDMSVEIDDLRSKLKHFEESYQTLHEDKTVLVTEKSLLLSQVDGITESLQNLEKTHSELRDQHSCLRKEKDSTVNQVEELKVLLEVQKQEQENLTRSCDALCNQIDFLQEEGRSLKHKLEEEEDECMNVQLESYMLQLCVHDMKQIYDLLLIECEEYVEKSSIADKLVLELGQKNQERETEFKSLLDEHSLSVHINQKLSAGILELLKLLDMVDDGCADLEDLKIIGKIKDMQIYITDARDEKQKLIFENLINATLLEQMRLGILDLIAEKEAIEMESARRKGELLILESEKLKLSETNKQLEQELQEKESREEVLKTEMGFMREQISDHQESNLTLRNENCKLLEENLSVKKDLHYLQEEKFKLEEENNAVLTNASTFENLALIFESSNAEKAMELRRVNADLDHFRAVEIDFENEKRETMEKTRTLEMELNTIRCLCENLNEEIGIGKNLLGHKEMELAEVNKNVESKHNEIAELRSDLEIVKQEFVEVRKIREVLEKQILVLSEEKIDQEKKISFVHQEKGRVKLELDKLYEEIEGFRLREGQLTSELGNWEKETATLFEDVQASSIREALFEEKVCDLIGACAKLEENARMEREKFCDEIDGFRFREEHLTTELGNWKEETATLFKDVQASSIREALFEEKVCGLIKACAKLEENTQMEREKFRDEIVGFRLREEHLTTELGNWEVETATLFKDVQASSVREVILEEKVCDLIGASAKLEENTQMEREKFRDEIEGFRLQEERLTTELGNWEVETATLFKDVQASSVREVILEEKVCDLIGASAKLEENTQMEREKFHDEIEGFRLREEHLTTELRNWEEETATLFGDVLTSSIREALLEEKISDLFGACLKLEDNTQMEREKFHDEISSRNTEIDTLNRKIAILEGENEAIKAESGAYLPIILSLRESLTLLEDRSLSLAKIHKNDAVEPQDFPSINHQNDDNNAHESSEEQSPEIPDVVLELHKLQTKVRAVENAMMELERLNQLVKDEHTDTEQENSNLDAAEKGVEDLKLQNNTVQEEGQINKDIVIEPEVEDGELSKDLEAAKTRGEICKGKTKDIELDPVSDTFSYEKSAGKDPKADDQMLELWETAERDCGHESMAERNIEYHQPEVVEEEKSTNPSSELQVEKELGIDDVVGPAKAPGTQPKKVIDRLSSNSRRLKKLQITVQELKTKCEKSKKTKKPMRDEYDNARGKLKQSEESIAKYADINSKLTKCAEDGSFKMNEDVERMLAETENTQKEPYELVRKGSVNIGKLELEVQGIQFLLHKLEQEHEIKGGVNFQRKTRVRLRDYLYGEKDKMKTKATLCGCMRPSTKDD